MSHKLYRLLEFFEEKKIWFRLDRHRDDSIMITATVVGKRIEIDVFEDEHIEYSVFSGNEDVEVDEDVLHQLLKENWEYPEAQPGATKE